LWLPFGSRGDLKLAGINAGNRESGFVDFHSLRMTLSTTMAAGGLTARVRQAHMRHTDPRLTENTYMDERLLPVADELATLPPFAGDDDHVFVQDVMGESQPAKDPAQLYSAWPEMMY
jgi:hypothetical protein